MGRPAEYNTPDELQKAVDDYFANVEGLATTVTGLALWLGFESRQSLYDYEKKPEFSYIIKKAKLKVEMHYELKLGTAACTGSIFALKNMGWRDKTEVEQSGGLSISWNEQRTYEADSKTDEGS